MNAQSNPDLKRSADLADAAKVAYTIGRKSITEASAGFATETRVADIPVAG